MAGGVVGIIITLFDPARRDALLQLWRQATVWLFASQPVASSQQPLAAPKNTVNRLASIVDHRNDPRIIHMPWTNHPDSADN